MRPISVIMTRRSVRKYTGEKIDDEAIKTLLECGMNAPSAGNAQPWHFVVIDDKRLLEHIPNVHPFSNMLPKASHAIVVCGDITLDKHKEYWVQDCSAAAQNILLAAHALGLGACWLGVYPYDERVRPITKLLNLPENIIPLNIIAIGVPAEITPAHSRFHPEKIHNNKW